MKKIDMLWMILGCAVPLLFIFLSPAFGFGGNSSLFIFIVLMFAVHLFMPHGSHGHGDHTNNDQNHMSHNNSNKNLTEDIESKEINKEHKHH
ncbi:hypothetical protein [Polaribacter sp.]|uniref:hypothetical protein n=1 Tax=Polaribacter sp. TaxID=1920175 RepID=UPI0040489E3C|tara:strand:+ start:490 stop:765 length:276 start_codon:yes stop_codon:yes gene_type:complete